MKHENDKPVTHFTPIPLRPRHDGWTAERQIAFIEKLADCGSVDAACRHVGMSRESAYRLRRRRGGRAFREAWEAAVDCTYAEVEESAAERSKNGVPRPIFYKGEQVGEWRHFDERLTMFLLRFRRARRFGPALDGQLAIGGIAVNDEAERRHFADEPELRLDGCLDGIEFQPEPTPWDVDDPSDESGE